jgi:hypothetical protein
MGSCGHISLRQAINAAAFEMTYNAFLERPALTKFMVIPHYAYNCDRESCEMTNALVAFVEHQNLKKAMVESLPDPIVPESKTSKLSIQLEGKLSKTILLSPSDPSKVTHVGNDLDPK